VNEAHSYLEFEMGEYGDLVARLRSNELLPVCPYDPRSPEYWTAPDDAPCRICGQENTTEGPDKCRGADTRCMAEAADAIAKLEAERTWQPIETAPKDGTDILGIIMGCHPKTGRPFIPEVIAWERDGWWNCMWECSECYADRAPYEPTHWVPLPPIPSPLASIHPDTQSQPHAREAARRATEGE